MSKEGADLIGILDSWLAGTGITLLELRTPTEGIRLARSVDDDPACSAQTSSDDGIDPSPGTVTVTAPTLGVFLDRHPLRAERLAASGQAVRAGHVVGLLQVGSLLLQVPAPVDGIVAQAVALPGDLVGYGAPLLRLQRRGRP